MRINSIWPSIIIVFINFALARGIRYFSAFEKHHTMTDYHTSVALKLTVAQCVNTALIAIIVNSSKSNWFVPGGLIVDMTWILLANAIVQPAFYLFNPPYMIKKCRRAMLRGSDKIMT